jgi:UDP-N-acetylbacillosamine N-acetyltransferase
LVHLEPGIKPRFGPISIRTSQLMPPSARRSSKARAKLVIWGAGGHAAIVADIIRLQPDYELVGFLDDTNPETRGTQYCGQSILGGREALPGLLVADVRHLIVCIGENQVRLNLAAFARANGFALATAIHPRATIAGDAVVEAGTVIAAGAVVNPGACVGEQVIVNTSASVDHHCVIEDGAHIGPGAHLGGAVKVRRGAWVGIGATIIERVEIGAGAIVGAGAVVMRDVPPRVVAYGAPARVVRKTIRGDEQEEP